MSMSEEEHGRTIGESALYLVEERLQTFEDSRWPFECGTCTPLKMSEAGFYYCGTESSPDWVRCVVCHQDMDGWEEQDNPRDEHKRNQPNCPFLKKDPYKITFADILELEKASLEYYANLEVDKLSADLQSFTDELKEELITADTVANKTTLSH